MQQLDDELEKTDDYNKHDENNTDLYDDDGEELDQRINSTEDEISSKMLTVAAFGIGTMVLQKLVAWLFKLAKGSNNNDTANDVTTTTNNATRTSTTTTQQPASTTNLNANANVQIQSTGAEGNSAASSSASSGTTSASSSSAGTSAAAGQ